MCRNNQYEKELVPEPAHERKISGAILLITSFEGLSIVFYVKPSFDFAQ